MVNSLYRWLFAVLGLSPIAVGLFCSGARDVEAVAIGALKGIAVVLVAVWLFRRWLRCLDRRCARVQMSPVTVSAVRSSPAAYFLAYVMPVVLGGHVSFAATMLIAGMLVFVCFFSESEDNNPVAKLLGYRFYEVSTSCGQTYLLMTKATMQTISGAGRREAQLAVVQVSDSFVVYFA